MNVTSDLNHTPLSNAEFFASNHRAAKKAASYLRNHQEKATATWDAWQNGTLTAAKLDLPKTMQLLNVWPLASPKGDVPRMEHLEAIFSDPRWEGVESQQKLGLIQQIPGLSGREQMFLMGGATTRALIQRQAAAGKGAER